MKLNSAQLGALSRDIAKKINARRNKEIEEITYEVNRKTKLSKQEEQAIKTLEKLQDGLLNGVIRYNIAQVSQDLLRVKKQNAIKVERVGRKVMEQMVNACDIQDQLVVASIDAKDVNELINIVAKQLGVKATEIQ